MKTPLFVNVIFLLRIQKPVAFVGDMFQEFYILPLRLETGCRSTIRLKETEGREGRKSS